MATEWDDEHRAAVQFLLRERCVSHEDITAFVGSIGVLDGINNKSNRDAKLKEFLTKVGSRLFDYGFKVEKVHKSVFDPEAPENARHQYALVNTKAEEVVSFATDLTTTELLYYKAALEKILETDDFRATEEELVYVARGVSHTQFSRKIVQDLHRKLVQRKWLAKEGKFISIGERAVAELPGYIKEEFPDADIRNCTFCNKIVLTRSVYCEACDSRYHYSCAWRRKLQNQSLCCDDAPDLEKKTTPKRSNQGPRATQPIKAEPDATQTPANGRANGRASRSSYGSSGQNGIQLSNGRSSNGSVSFKDEEEERITQIRRSMPRAVSATGRKRRLMTSDSEDD